MGLRNVIENGLRAGEDSSLIDLRREAVRRLQPASKRMAVQAIDEVMFALKKVHRYVNERDAVAAGLLPLKGGVEAAVYRQGDAVLKYVRRSDSLNTVERRELAARKQDDFIKLHSGMAAYVLDQTISVAPHLFSPSQEVVQTVQPFVAFRPIMFQRSLGEHIELLPSAAFVADDLTAFIESAWRTFGNTGVLPDVLGRNNIVIDENGQVTLLDTQPITDESIVSRDIQVRIMREMDSISEQLDKIAP